MSLFEHHIFVCINERDSSDARGCCAARDSKSVLEAFRVEVHARGLKGKIRVNKAGCLDQCANGPSVVIYPEGTWYAKLCADDVPEILDALEKRDRVDRLLHSKLKS